MNKDQKHILWFKEIRKSDVGLVGGKNASLGEIFSQLTQKDINVPDGFALTASAYRAFLKENNIDKGLKEIFNKFNPNSIKSLKETGQSARNLILRSDFSQDLKKEILENYKKLSQKYSGNNIDVAVRSSATAEDLPSASFAGQHETYLNIFGAQDLLRAIKKCIASLFTDRAIVYREEKGFNHLEIALSVCVQKMVRSDLGSAGVMFTLDTETGFSNVVLINSIYGIGEMIVKGQITPDEFYVFKPTLNQGYKAIISKQISRKTKKYIYHKKQGIKEIKVSKKEQFRFSLSDKEVLTLAQWAVRIEEHYNMPQDIEWAKDGRTGKLFIVQARPETVHAVNKNKAVYEEYKIKTNVKPILQGIAVGDKIGQGRVRKISHISEIALFQKGEVLVTEMTNPDWVPAMKMAKAMTQVTGRGYYYTQSYYDYPTAAELIDWAYGRLHIHSYTVELYCPGTTPPPWVPMPYPFGKPAVWGNPIPEDNWTYVGHLEKWDNVWLRTRGYDVIKDLAPPDLELMLKGWLEASIVMIESEPSGAGPIIPDYIGWYDMPCACYNITET